ncbi:MFS transporter [Pseudomonas cavernicola]|uniref:MFS transporter n=1 Tax=Pseudomonas cavernicola TaxID=2320866 RepID=A0A418XMV8_9PSED|nr:MFS transporter [Pseudomonas cavernicola]RJG13812.1 MFS transporter [Pseudomonas cavernicola]
MSTQTDNTPERTRLVVVAASLGTVFEWYDFYLYGSLAVFFSALFFPPGNDTAAFLASLATFGAGFAVRPLGALIFGRLGDRIGRKHTFLITMVLMGISTTVVGLLPSYAQIGLWAPALLVAMRLVQGLAVGGEYGGAATYVAEYAPAKKRGYATSWIQTTATGGFLISLVVILGCRLAVGEENFRDWGWRIPFLISLVLLGVSVFIRLKLAESPVFQHMKDSGELSEAPISESFGNWKNLKQVLIVLFGITSGMTVIWYSAQFYALFFLQNTLHVDFQNASLIFSVGLLLGTPMIVLFGWLSDRVGRKRIMLAGMLLGALTLIPIFKGIAFYANPQQHQFAERYPIVLNGGICHFSLFAKPQSDCDRASQFFAKAGLSYQTNPGNTEQLEVRIGEKKLIGFDETAYREILKNAGYREKANPEEINHSMVILLIILLMTYVGMVYGPMAAFMVEMFPARIRYTSLSLPYHIGIGILGGFLPFLAAALVVYSGNIFAGLYYPVAVALISAVIGVIWVPETYQRDIT